MNAMSCGPFAPGDWRIGKTFETIEFVKCAEECIEKLNGDAHVIARFRLFIEKIKCGDTMLIGSHLPLPPLHDFF